MGAFDGPQSRSSTTRPTTLQFKSGLVEVNNNMLDMSDMMPTGPAPKRNKKRRPAKTVVKRFDDVYEPTGQKLGAGATGSVATYRHKPTGEEYAVKIIKKHDDHGRHKVLKEIEIFHHCKGHANILQLFEYFEEELTFYMVFEKMEGGTLLETIERRGHITEQEASQVIRDVAGAIDFLHQKGIAHRDLKPENILCVNAGKLTPVKICDFDLGSGVIVNSRSCTPATTPELLTPVGSAEFMAPEVVDVWQDQAWSYDKRCDLWSLGIILYMMLCGYPPFYGQCGQDCGWERGDSCTACQDMLFQRIQDGIYDFPEEEWSQVSDAAKDLISHLLVKDPHQRYTAEEVLDHKWVKHTSSNLQLATPRVLQRNNSVKELEAFAESANAYNRLILRHLSISEAFEPPSFHADRFNRFNHDVEDDSEPIFRLDNDSHCMFQIGDLSEEGSSGEDENDTQLNWIGLSPPGDSSLARRRSTKKNTENVDYTQKNNRSPPKVLSSIF